MAFLDDLAALPTLRAAFREVAARRGVAGIDRVTVDEFERDLERNLEGLSVEIRAGRYRPLPVVRIRPRFLAASDRALVVPAVRDRLVQRAIADLLTPAIDPLLSPACRAFRKGSSARQAVDDVGRLLAEGNPWVLRADVRSFFDRIRPDLVLGQLEPFVDAAGLRFLDRLLRQRIFDHDEVSDRVEGIAQGSPLSPLLGNLYLADLDRTLHAEHPSYLRYCDDLLVLAASEEEVRKAHARLVLLLAPLGLELNGEKTRICRAEDGFSFLGYRFDATGRGPAEKAVAALGFRLDEIATAATVDPAELDALYRGWSRYFGEHPEIWMESPAGLLALLRGGGGSTVPEEALRSRLVAARWRSPARLAEPLALALARAWTAAGLAEQAWLELAEVAATGTLSTPSVAAWCEVLSASPEELSRLAARLAGDGSDRLAALTEAVAETGRYELAHLLATARAWAEAEREPSSASGPAQLDERDARLLDEWFQGREGVHARETVNRAGQRWFVPVRRPLCREDWEAHLRGELSLALPLVRAGDTALLGVLDVDVARRALADRHGVPDDLLGRALGTALKLRQELERRGLASLLEASGYKGYHLWLRLDEPVPCFRLRRFLLDVVAAIGALPEGIRVEELPSRDRVRGDTLGPLVKLPLGVHRKTGRRCDLLDDRGRPLADPFEALRSHSRTPAQTVLDATAPDRAEAAPAADRTAHKIGPRARRLLDGCKVLGFLERKAASTSYLNHRERSTLLYTLGHLGEEGRAALHAVIAHTYNYRPEVTDRHIARLPPWPISCPKVRELHPEAAAVAPCSCRFELHGRGYPTPVLHVLGTREIPVFEKSWREARRAPARAPTAAAPSRGEGVPSADELLAKIGELKRHRRGIDASLERLHRELGALFEESGGDTLEVSLGTLRRIKNGESDGWDFVVEV